MSHISTPFTLALSPCGGAALPLPPPEHFLPEVEAVEGWGAGGLIALSLSNRGPGFPFPTGRS